MLQEKKVSSLALSRLKHAKNAITHTKQVFKYGAGNQSKALRKSRLNSAYRLHVQRTDKYWSITPEAKKIADSDRAALIAARAYITNGGNCGEHAAVAYDYLRATAIGQLINYSSKSGLDHAFVVIGDTVAGADNELVVSDPWPTDPTATIWRDHFAYDSNRANLKVAVSATADGQSKANSISSGLTLSEEGQKILTMKASEKETEEHIDNSDHVWNHADAAATGKKFQYYAETSTGEKEML